MAESDQLAVHSAVAPAGALGHPQHRSAQYGQGPGNLPAQHRQLMANRRTSPP